MNKKIVLLCVLVSLIMGMFVNAYADSTPEITVEDVVTNDAADEEIAVSVRISNNPGFAGVSFIVDYNHDCLEYKSISYEDAVIPSGGLSDPAILIPAGAATSYSTGSNITGDGTLFTLIFAVKDNKAGEYGITVKTVEFVNGDGIETSFNDAIGAITVSHSSLTHYDAVTPNCTTDGTIEYWNCSGCGKNFSDEAGTIEIASVVDPAAGHTPAEAVKENEVAATCTTAGSYDEVVYCSVCGEEVSRTAVTVPAGHTPAEAVKENEAAATCKAEGSYDEVVYCSVCGEEISRTAVTTPPAGHTPAEAVKENEVAATCTVTGSYDEVVYCSVCGTEISRTAVTVPAGHTPAEAVKENEAAPTCTATGSYDEVVYCSVCGEEISRTAVTVPAGHTPAEAVKENEAAATCTAAGSYDEVVYCSVCGEEISRTAVTVNALGHSWGEWNVTQEATETETGLKTRSCSACGETESQIIPVLEHVHQLAPVEASQAACTADGNAAYYVCSGCGQWFWDAEGTQEILNHTDVVIPAGHTAADTVKENEITAACTTAGTYDEVVYCSVCGEEISRTTVSVPATGHTAADAVIQNKVAASCTANGSYDEVVSCSVCGEVISRKTVTTSALGHTWSEWILSKTVSTTDNGEMTRTCTVCGATDVIAIPAAGAYEIAEGADGMWTRGSKDNLSFTVKRDEYDEVSHQLFEGLEVDGAMVDSDNYSIQSGNVIIEIKAEYLETLSTGEHTIKVNFTDGATLEEKFTIKDAVIDSEYNTKETESTGQPSRFNKSSDSGSDQGGDKGPKTGDESDASLWLTLFLICAASAAVILVNESKCHKTHR